MANQHAPLAIDGISFAIFGIDFPLEAMGGGIISVVESEGDQRFLRLGPSRKDTYTFYYPKEGEEVWKNYTISARLRIDNVNNSGAGVTFYSQLHHGLDHYYRLRWSAVEGKFRFVPHNTAITHGQAELPVAMPADKWYRCKVQVSTEPHQTRMTGKVWPDGQAEPAEWQATAYDSSARCLGSGPVGLWSIYEGRHDFDDLLVVAQNGDTMLKEDWEGGLFPKKPPSWIDWGYHGQVLSLMAAAAPESGLRILLYHNPEFAEKAAPAGMDLMLAGHTHGGQVRLPLLGAVWLYKDMEQRRDAGLFHEGPMRLI